jgi:hypothetical protein
VECLLLALSNIPLCTANVRFWKLNERLAEADETKDTKILDELSQQIDALGKKLGPEYAALMDALQDVDLDSDDGKQIGLMFEPLDKLCAK